MDFAIYAIGMIAIMTVLLAGQQLLLFDCGILSLGTPAFFAGGGYISAVLAKDAGYPVIVSIMVASVVGTGLALLVGYPWLRALRSDFFAVATLALAQASVAVLRAAGPGGLAGMAGVPPFPALLPRVPPQIAATLLAVGVSAITILAVQTLRRRRIGIVMAAVRIDENSAAAQGFRPLLVKLQVFVLSSFLAALAGAMQAHMLGVVDPRMASIDTTVLLLVATVLSGSRGAWGAVFGASFAVLTPELLQRLLLQRAQPRWWMFLLSQGVYGAILIVFALFLPWLRGFGALRSQRA